jgi:hypothetical protein
MDLRALIAKMDHIEATRTLMEAGDPAEYARAQQQMANLEKAAQYTGDDEIVRGRMGLPPKLPPIEQWDGKMPAPVGKPDWIARAGSLGKATTDQATAVATNQADDSSVAFKKDKLTQLKALVAKISAAPAAESIVFNSAIARSLVESFNYSLKESDIEEKVTLGTGPATTNPATGVTAGKFQGEVAEIQKIMSELSDMGDDPEVGQALTDAQAAIDKLAQAPAAAADPAAAGGAPADPAAAAGAGTIDPAKLKRFKELLAKAGQPAPATAAGGAPAGAATKPAAGAKSDPAVLKIQQDLIAKGAKIKADGVMGPATQAAMKQFGGAATKPAAALPGQSAPGQISDNPAA